MIPTRTAHGASQQHQTVLVQEHCREMQWPNHPLSAQDTFLIRPTWIIFHSWDQGMIFKKILGTSNEDVKKVTEFI